MLKDNKMFTQHDRVYKSSKGSSIQFHEIVPDEITVRRDSSYIFRGRNSNGITGPHETVFHEVNKAVVTEVWAPEVKSLLAQPIERKQVSTAKFAQIIFDALLKVIEDSWIPERFHVILHSSGYDSRLISLAIKRLYKKQGKDWLGKILFMEINQESKQFLEIMRIEGWDRSQYIIYPGHERSFEFSNAWKRLNGDSCFPVNFWWEPIEWLQECGLAPSDDQLQCWSGLHGTETQEGVKKGLDWFLRKIYYGYDTWTMPLKGEWVLPFINLEFLRTLIEYSQGQAPYYRKTVLDCIAPHIQKVPHIQPNFISSSICVPDHIFNQVVKDYRSSWFGREVRPEITPTKRITFSEWWGYWCAASFCEYLRENGHKIEMER